MLCSFLPHLYQQWVLTVQSAASTDGLTACHVCEQGLIWLTWATSQDDLPAQRGEGCWIWLAGGPESSCDSFLPQAPTWRAWCKCRGIRGKWEAAGAPAVSWASGVIVRRGMRAAAAEVDIYIMTVFEAGSETKVVLRHFPSPIPLPTAAPVGDPGRASAMQTRLQPLTGVSELRFCRVQEAPLPLHIIVPPFSPVSSALWWREHCCTPAALQECHKGLWDNIYKTQSWSLENQH